MGSTELNTDIDRNDTISTVDRSSLPAIPAYITEIIIHTLAALSAKMCRQLYGMNPHSIFNAILLALLQASVKSFTEAPSIPNDLTTGNPLVYSRVALVSRSFSAFNTLVLAALCFDIINRKRKETSTPPKAINAHSGMMKMRNNRIHRKLRYSHI